MKSSILSRVNSLKLLLQLSEIRLKKKSAENLRRSYPISSMASLEKDEDNVIQMNGLVMDLIMS